MNYIVPNSAIHPDLTNSLENLDNSRDSSPSKGNRTPGRRLSPPKHLTAPIPEVTENDSAEEQIGQEPTEANNHKNNTEGVNSRFITHLSLSCILLINIFTFLH